MEKIRLRYTPQPRQLVFHNTKADQILYGGCVSGDTEFLTPYGWKRIDEYDADAIATWAPDGRIEFDGPLRYIDMPCQELIEFVSGRLDMCLSPDHRVPAWNWNKRFIVKLASRLENHPSKHWIPISTKPPESPGLKLTDDEIRLAVAIHADGSFDGGRDDYCRVALRKQRKKDRLQALLKKCGIQWKLYQNKKRPTEVRYSFTAPITSKTYADWWSINEAQMSIVLDEMSHWDGNVAGAEGGDLCFNTTIKGDADFMQYVAHGLGHYAHIGCEKAKSERHSDVYKVQVSREPFQHGVSLRQFDKAANKGVQINRVPAKRMYCFETETGFWVARRNGKIFCTGNSAGGGKSHCLRWDAIDFCLHIPNLNATLFRRTLPMLLKNHIIPIRRELPPALGLGRYNETRKMFEFANGSILQFQHIEYDRDVDDIQGSELHWAGVDEAGQMTPYMLGWIFSRVRLGEAKARFLEYVKLEPTLQPYLDRLPRVAMGSNPGGEAHHYLKELFIDPAPPETVFESEYLSPLTKQRIVKTRIFIPAKMTDNDYLDTDYEAQFSEMPDWQQKQLVEGDWDVVPGAFFDCWSSSNVIRPFSVPDHWTRLWSCDWGFRQPFWIGEWVVSDGLPVVGLDGESLEFPEECLILIREWYGQKKGNEGLRMSAFNVGQGLREWRDADIKVADPSMWRSDSGPSPAERMAQAGIYWGRADNERVAGWQEMYGRIRDDMLLAFDTCRHFIRTIPTLMHDEKKIEDVLKKGEDHAGDGGRYACMARPYKREKKSKTKPWHENVRPPTFNEIMTSRKRGAQGHKRI